MSFKDISALSGEHFREFPHALKSSSLDHINNTDYPLFLTCVCPIPAEPTHYEYDFGDGWSHKITLEKILPFEVSSGLVKCIAGKRACPPEDCGGIWGYASLLEAVDDPNHPEHEEMVEWLDEGFDPAHFSLSDVNVQLQRYIKCKP